MELSQTVEILSQVGLSAVAAFLSILLWSNTRDSAWLFIIVGVIVKFAEVIYTTLEMFGIVRSNLFTFSEVAVGRVILVSLPYILFSIGFIIMITRNRVRYQAIAAELKEAGDKEKKRKAGRKAEGESSEPEPRKADEVPGSEAPAAEAGETAAERPPAAAPSEAVPVEVEELTEADELEEIEEVDEAEELTEPEELEEIEDAEEEPEELETLEELEEVEPEDEK